MKKIAFTVIFLCLVTLVAASPPIELTTSFPEPTGQYDRIRLKPRNPTSNPVVPLCDDPSQYGLMYVDSTAQNSLFFCSNTGWGPFSGLWSKKNDYVFPTQTTANPNLEVGIATTEPDSTLQVDGNINIRDDGTLFLDMQGTGNSPAEVSLIGEAFAPNHDIAFYAPGTGEFNFIPEIDNPDTFMVLHADGNKNTPALLVDTLHRRVGINPVGPFEPTTPVQAPLHVFGGQVIADPSPVLHFSDTDIPASDPDDDDFALTVDNKVLSIQSFFGGTAYDRIYMDTRGNLGLGENDPIRRLHITVDTNQLHSPENAAIRFRDNTNLSSLGYKAKWDLGVDDTNGKLYLWGGDFFGSDYRFVIEPAEGKIGIGNTDPLTALHVGPGFGTPEFDFGAMKLEGFTPKIYFETAFPTDSDFEIHAQADKDILTITPHPLTQPFAFNVTKNRKVGIGTSAPVSMMHVAGDHTIDPNMRYVIIQAIHPGFRWHADAPTPNFRMRSTDTANNQLRFETDDNRDGTYDIRMVIHNNGNVGIGTTNPTGTLHVVGTVYLDGAQLHPDYVFESDYELESIEEHAEFMWKEKHLKAMPKAEKDEQGREFVRLDEYSTGMIEELEKAYLYIGQLHERLEDLENTVLKIRKQQ